MRAPLRNCSPLGAARLRKRVSVAPVVMTSSTTVTACNTRVPRDEAGRRPDALAPGAADLPAGIACPLERVQHRQPCPLPRAPPRSGAAWQKPRMRLRRAGEGTGTSGCASQSLGRARRDRRCHVIGQGGGTCELEPAHDRPRRARVGDGRPHAQPGERDRLRPERLERAAAGRAQDRVRSGRAAGMPRRAAGRVTRRGARADSRAACQTAALPLRQSRRVTHPHLHWNITVPVVLTLGLYAGIYVWRWRAARREEGGRGAGAAQLRVLRRRARGTDRRNRLADRRPRRGLPVLDAHAPAHPARGHRAGLPAARPLARDHAAGHPPAGRRRAGARPLRTSADRPFPLVRARLLLAHPRALRRGDRVRDRARARARVLLHGRASRCGGR